MRFLGVLCLSLSVLAFGFSQIQIILSRQSLYITSAAFWSEFRRLLADTHAPPGEILQRLIRFPRYKKLDFAVMASRNLPGRRFQEAYHLALEESSVRSLEIYPLLVQAGEILGTVSLDHQLERLDSIVARLEELAQEHQRHIDSSLRLWRSLSVCGALFVFIFLI